jgi:hypothetical protein
MRKRYGKYGMLGVLVLALLLVLLLTAGPASASSTTVTKSTFMGFLDAGESETLPDGTVYTPAVTMPTLWYSATGPEGWRLLGWNVACVDIWWPVKGDNFHTGVMVGLTTDPYTFWDADLSFEENLEGRTDLTWRGTWDGHTRNKYNHTAAVSLTGVGVNDGWTVEGTSQCGLFEVNWRNPNYDPDTGAHYVDTPWVGVYTMTPPPQ